MWLGWIYEGEIQILMLKEILWDYADKKTNQRITIWSSNSTSQYTHKEMKAETGRDICIPMLTAVLPRIAKRWDITQMLINRWIDEQNTLYIHNRILLTLKKNIILIHAMTWMNLEDVTLNEISQSQKDKYCMIPSIMGTEGSKIHRLKGNCLGLENCLIGKELYFRKMKKFWEWMSWWLHYCINVLNVTELYTENKMINFIHIFYHNFF